MPWRVTDVWNGSGRRVEWNATAGRKATSDGARAWGPAGTNEEGERKGAGVKGALTPRARRLTGTALHGLEGGQANAEKEKQWNGSELEKGGSQTRGGSSSFCALPPCTRARRPCRSPWPPTLRRCGSDWRAASSPRPANQHDEAAASSRKLAINRPAQRAAPNRRQPARHRPSQHRPHTSRRCPAADEQDGLQFPRRRPDSP